MGNNLENNHLIPITLLNLFNSIIPLDDVIIADISQKLKFTILKKKEILLKIGSICNSIYFIEKGMVRSYYLESENQVTTWFMKENDLIISVKSFFEQTKSNECIEAIEETHLHYISFANLLQLYTKYHTFSLIGLQLTQYYYIKSEERLINLRKKDATAKYKYLLSNHPDILLRCPLTHVASYLNITLETLSRLRGLKI